MINPYTDDHLLDPKLCEECGEGEAFLGSRLCFDCDAERRAEQDEAAFWEGSGPAEADLLLPIDPSEFYAFLEEL
jgi:hypothetical protein